MAALPPPPTPELPESKPAKGSFLSLIMAGTLAAMLFTGLFFITLGWIGGPLLLGVGIFGLAAFHYLVWGWWLSKLIHQDVEREEKGGEK